MQNNKIPLPPTRLPPIPEIPQELPEIPQELPEIPQELPEIPPELPEIPPELPEIPPEIPEIPQKPFLNTIKSLNTRPILTTYNELIKQFLRLYIGNLYQADEESNHKNNRTQKKNNKKPNTNKRTKNNTAFISKYNDYIRIISEIYGTTPEELFRKLYETTINYRDLLPEKNENAQDFYYVNTHGGFKAEMTPKLIPEKTVLIFLTPVNRYGICGTLEDLLKIKEIFKNKDYRLLIQQNLPCLDKFNDDANNKLNTRDLYNYHKMFKNAIILYPGQYYYDLVLGFTKENDNGKNLNISYFTGDSETQDLIKIEKDKNNKLNTDYEDYLSNIVNKQFDEKYINFEKHKSHSGIRYIIVNCCRNIDASYMHNQYFDKKFGKSLYIYENFMFYYNVIMANCYYSKSIPDIAEMPKIRYASYSGYIMKETTKQRWDKNSHILKQNFRNMLYLDPTITEKLQKLFKAALALKDFDESQLNSYFIHMSLEYENNKIVIDTNIMFKLLTQNYKKKKIRNSFITYVNYYNNKLLYKIIFDVYYILERDYILGEVLIDRSKLESLKNDIETMLTQLDTLFDDTLHDDDYGIFKLLKKNIKSCNVLINKCLEKNKLNKIINLLSDCKKRYIYLHILNKFNFYEKLYHFYTNEKKNYDEISSELDKLLIHFLSDPKNMLSKKLATIKNDGNRALGNTGRKTLMKTYFKKTNKNTKLSPAIQKLIEEESNKLISNLKLQGLENETNA
jgi:hypothetical protein